jgi:peptidoglycan/LPS O-acetylase OafA/YrhL
VIVFLFHFGGGTHSSLRIVRFVGLINKGGWVGVSLFFVLSGFLITGILWDSFDQPHWWRNFYIRRALRIFPLYYGSIFLVMLAAALAGTFQKAIQLIWIPILFLQNMPHLHSLVDQIASPLGLFHFWSLAVEEQFYLIWPFLLFAFRRSRDHARNLCITVFLISCLFRILIWTFDPAGDYGGFLITRAGELAAGGWLALAYRGTEWHRIQRFAPAVALVAITAFIATGIITGSFNSGDRAQMIYGLPCITIGFAALLTMAMKPGFVQRCAEASWLRWLGGISYGIYVFHMLFLSLYSSIERRIFGSRSELVTHAALFVIAAVGAVVSAWISFHFFETPFLKLKDRFASRPRTS